MKRWMLFLYLSSSRVCEKAEEVKRLRLRLRLRLKLWKNLNVEL